MNPGPGKIETAGERLQPGSGLAPGTGMSGHPRKTSVRVVPEGARVDLSVLYDGVWRRPDGPKPFPLWVRRVKPAPATVECYEVAWSDNTTMFVDEEERGGRSVGRPPARLAGVLALQWMDTDTTTPTCGELGWH